jgi:glycine cleavage system transcriptional repressor
MSPASQKILITGVGPDRPGIVAGLTEVLFRHQCNIEDSSMTILAREFSWLLLVNASPSASFEQIKHDIQSLGEQMGLTILVKAIEVDTNEVETVLQEDQQAHMLENRDVMIAVSGQDKTGITYQVAKVLAETQVNILDLNAHCIEGEDGPVYIMMIEAKLPTNLEQATLENTLNSLAKKLGVEIRVNPLEVLTL